MKKFNQVRQEYNIFEGKVTTLLPGEARGVDRRGKVKNPRPNVRLKRCNREARKVAAAGATPAGSGRQTERRVHKGNTMRFHTNKGRIQTTRGVVRGENGGAIKMLLTA